MALRVRGWAAAAPREPELGSSRGGRASGPHDGGGRRPPFERAEGTRAAPALLPRGRSVPRCGGLEAQVGTLLGTGPGAEGEEREGV